MREPNRFLLVQFNVMSNLTKGFRRDLRRLQPPVQSGAFVRGEEVVDAALAVVELPVLLGLGGVNRGVGEPVPRRLHDALHVDDQVLSVGVVVGAVAEGREAPLARARPAVGDEFLELAG